MFPDQVTSSKTDQVDIVNTHAAEIDGTDPFARIVSNVNDAPQSAGIFSIMATPEYRARRLPARPVRATRHMGDNVVDIRALRILLAGDVTPQMSRNPGPPDHAEDEQRLRNARDVLMSHAPSLRQRLAMVFQNARA